MSKRLRILAFILGMTLCTSACTKTPTNEGDPLNTTVNFFITYNKVLNSLKLPNIIKIGDSFLTSNQELTELILNLTTNKYAKFPIISSFKQ